MIEADTQTPLVLFGKLPAQGDFLRVHMQAAWCPAFEVWLTHAVEQARGKLPSHAVRFLLTLGDAPQRVVGTWIPSVDAVGREFPLAALRLLPQEITAAPWSLLPAFYADYLDEIEQRLSGLRTGEPSVLLPALSAIALPHASLIPAAWREGQLALASETIDGFAARNVPDDHLDHLAYALATLGHARDQSSEPLTLDLPASNELDLFAWLEIARALKIQASAPSVLWSESEQRALLMLGSPTALAIAFLLDREHPSQRRWPLSTSRENARQLARESLTPTARQALSAGDSMASLLAAMASEVSP